MGRSSPSSADLAAGEPEPKHSAEAESVDDASRLLGTVDVSARERCRGTRNRGYETSSGSAANSRKIGLDGALASPATVSKP